MAQPGEQVEAVVVARARHRDPGLRGRDRVAVVGAVPGRRHPGHRRRPAGLRLRRHLRRRRAGRDAGRGPRQRRLRHARRVPGPGRARRRGGGRARPLPTRRSSRSRPTARSRWPSSSSGPRWPPTRASRASSRPSTPTPWLEGAIVSTTGIRTVGAETACYLSTYVMADRGRRDPDRVRLLGRARARASSTSSRGRADAGDAGHPPARARPSRPASGSPSCSTRGSPRSSSASSASRSTARRC